jgi:hypothetical protein
LKIRIIWPVMVGCALVCLFGCGKNDYLADTWVYAFFTDSATIGAVHSHYIENRPNTGIGESWNIYRNFSCDIRTCNLDGDSEKVLMTTDTGMYMISTLLGRNTVCKSPLVGFEANNQPLILDLSTRQTEHPYSIAVGFSWDGAYYFYVSYVNDTLLLYDAKNKSFVARLPSCKAVNLDRTGTRLLIEVDSCLEYFNMADGTVDTMTDSRSRVIVNDYKLGLVALVKDSSGQFICMPDLMTLSPDLAALNWPSIETAYPQWRGTKKVYNLRNGDYVYSRNSNVFVGNILSGLERRVLAEKKIKLPG